MSSYNLDTVWAAFTGRIGWAQSINPSDPVLADSNKLSASGLFYNDGSFHVLVTLSNVKETIGTPNLTDAGFNSELARMDKAVAVSCLASVFNEPKFLDSDFTDTIVANAALFDTVRGLKMAAMVVAQILYNTRSNATERALKEGVMQGMAMLDLNGVIPTENSPKVSGLNRQIEQELARLKQLFYPKQKAVCITIC